MFQPIRIFPAAPLVLAVLLSSLEGQADPLQAVAVPVPFVGARVDSGTRSPGGTFESPEAFGPLSLLSAGPAHLVPGSFPVAKPRPGLPKVFVPSQPRESYTRYPWRLEIVATVFWIGELPSRNNPTPNTKSAWDRSWTSSYGGYDDPDPRNREGLLPRKFTPGQNPFYFALPYNDISKTGTKPSARAMVPWFRDAFYRNGRTVLKGRWIAIRRGEKVCYAQWEDVGPFETDDWEYVFGGERPKTTKNRGAGLDVSPAVRDYLDFEGGYGTVDWRFVDVAEVPAGPWRDLGANNPFANPSLDPEGFEMVSDDLEHALTLRERLLGWLDGEREEEGSAGGE
jgi:hypothetical protein